MITVCFRLDDPSPSSDKNVEAQIIDAFTYYGLPLSVAVVPFSKEGREKISSKTSPHIINGYKNNILEVALHGYSHTRRGKANSGIEGEFVGINLEEQHRLMENGRDALREFIGSEIDGFVPPFNLYDRFTLQAAKELGFKWISAGPSVIIRDSELAIMPATCNLINARRVLDMAIRYKKQFPIVIINFHPDDFEEYKWPPLPGEIAAFTNIKQLKSLLNRVKNTDEMQVSHLGSIFQQKGSHTQLVHLNEVDLFRHIPWQIKKKMPNEMLFQRNVGTFFGILARTIV